MISTFFSKRDSSRGTWRFKIGISILIVVSGFGYGAKSVFAQTQPNVLYVPLIGITSVPEPLALPKGPGKVTYKYAVKNFLQEAALTNVQVVDDSCNPVTFVTGDDNNDSMLDYSETWRYTCTRMLATTTQSTATAQGTANNLVATHNAYATVVVGLKDPAPLVSIVNITKVAYPLSLPSGGGDITFTYRVNNPGDAPLSDVVVSDNKCKAMSGKLGDTNGNNVLDTNEVWIYTCTTHLTQTSTNTVTVTASANGLRATDNATLTVKVDIPVTQVKASLPNTGTYPQQTLPPKPYAWEVLLGVLSACVIFLLALWGIESGKNQKKSKSFRKKQKI